MSSPTAKTMDQKKKTVNFQKVVSFEVGWCHVGTWGTESRLGKIEYRSLSPIDQKQEQSEASLSSVCGEARDSELFRVLLRKWIQSF